MVNRGKPFGAVIDKGRSPPKRWVDSSVSYCCGLSCIDWAPGHTKTCSQTKTIPKICFEPINHLWLPTLRKTMFFSSEHRATLNQLLTHHFLYWNCHSRVLPQNYGLYKHVLNTFYNLSEPKSRELWLKLHHNYVRCKDNVDATSSHINRSLHNAMKHGTILFNNRCFP